ncbi:Exosome complex component MTR3 [Galdieria sulphuraria]|nr:Exosome complex component MTR3 [Galdieria sulphuraria]
MERRISQRYGPFFEPIHSLEREYQRTRPNNAPRSLVLNTGTVVDAAGSGYVELGKTKVIVAVQGPRPPIRIRGGVENTMNGRITCEDGKCW